MAQRKSHLQKVTRRMRRRLDRLADSPALLGAASALIAARLRRWHARTDWRVEGQEALVAALRDGPVILAVWHGRLAMTPFMWRAEWGPVCSLTSSARPGRIVAGVLARFGWRNAAMQDKGSNRSASIQVARMIRQGTSVGIACDGPLGPVHVMKSVPLDWARLSGAPIWLWTYSVERHWHLNTWDRLIVPRPGGRGVMLYREWGRVPKRLTPEALEAMRARLGADLTALTAEADRAAGHG